VFDVANNKRLQVFDDMHRSGAMWMIALIIVYILIPMPAYAWGPGTHIEVAMHVLAHIGLVAPFIRKLITRYSDAYIYGAASPDIVLGKKYAGYLHHCHNWRIGWLILHEAKSDLERAAAYGYMTHLAADIVAHNYYIPYKIIRSHSARMLTHTYWEMRFDLGVHEQVWERLNIISDLNVDAYDALLERVLKKTLFSFQTNKRIFNTIVILQKMRRLREQLLKYAKRSKYVIHPADRQHYLDLTYDAVFNFLKNPETSDSMDVDPTGSVKLAYAKNLRRQIRQLMRRGAMDATQADQLVELCKERLAMGLYMPEMQLPDIVDIWGCP